MESAPQQPTTADVALYAHHPLVKDALIEGGDGVTDRTALAALYRYDNPGVDNSFLKNISGICKVKVRCQVLFDHAGNSVALPPSTKKGRHGFTAFLTFNLLSIAPSVRLEVHFIKQTENLPYLKLALEFPFNDRLDKQQLRDFEYRTERTSGQASIRFKSFGATRDGFTRIVRSRLSQEEFTAVNTLQSLASSAEPKQLHFLLQAQELTSHDRADFQKLIDRLPGGDGALFPSIGRAEWNNYPIDRDGNMLKPKDLMTLDVPNPMVPLNCPFSFGSPRHFTVDLLSCAAMTQVEANTVLLLFAMCNHQVALYGLKEIPVIAMKYGAFPKNAIVDDTGLRLPNELEIKVRFWIPGVPSAEFTAVRDPYLQGLPEHDAYFIITSHELGWFNGKHLVATDEPKYTHAIDIVPHPNKQLAPVNTSVTKELQCNPFACRADMSMLDRLIGLRFPYIRLDVQQRMHPALWSFPSSEFYGVQHRNTRKTDLSLERVEPGLKAVLDGIIAKSSFKGDGAEQDRVKYMANATDQQTRLHYLDFGVQEEVYSGANKRSRAIPRHVQAVFDLVFPALQKHFGDRTNREVMIIAAYGNAVGHYHKQVEDLQVKQQLNASHYPRILTVDSSQGQEAKMVIVDNSMQYCDKIGFMTEPGRSNVAMTREKEVLWMMGGPLAFSGGWTSYCKLSPFPKYKKVMELCGQVHKLSI